MPSDFYKRLAEYYHKVGEVLRGSADASSIFPNTTDKGMSREMMFAQFLENHLPSNCEVSFGGFLFGIDGSESHQLDLILSTPSSPRFSFGGGKSFFPVNGAIGVVSVKSKLDKKELFNSLDGLASIPPNPNLEDQMFMVKSYPDWPYSIIYAHDGISRRRLTAHLTSFYSENSDIPITRRPNIIYVSGQVIYIRDMVDITVVTDDPKDRVLDQYTVGDEDVDVLALSTIILQLQNRADTGKLLSHRFNWIFNEMLQSIDL